MLTLLVGIVLGWLIPRPEVLAPVEQAIWGRVKVLVKQLLAKVNK
jgi:hypothetical protein